MDRCTLDIKSTCNGDCKECMYYSDLPKKLTIKLFHIIDNYKEIEQICTDTSVHECNEGCTFFRPAEYDWDGVWLAGCRLGFKFCPFKNKRDKEFAIKTLKSKIARTTKEIIKAGGIIKTKWLCDKDCLEGNWCLGCKYDNENGISICKECTFCDKFEEEYEDEEYEEEE